MFRHLSPQANCFPRAAHRAIRSPHKQMFSITRASNPIKKSPQHHKTYTLHFLHLFSHMLLLCMFKQQINQFLTQRFQCRNTLTENKLSDLLNSSISYQLKNSRQNSKCPLWNVLGDSWMFGFFALGHSAFHTKNSQESFTMKISLHDIAPIHCCCGESIHQCNGCLPADHYMQPDIEK